MGKINLNIKILSIYSYLYEVIKKGQVIINLSC